MDLLSQAFHHGGFVSEGRIVGLPESLFQQAGREDLGRLYAAVAAAVDRTVAVVRHFAEGVMDGCRRHGVAFLAGSREGPLQQLAADERTAGVMNRREAAVFSQGQPVGYRVKPRFPARGDLIVDGGLQGAGYFLPVAGPVGMQHENDLQRRVVTVEGQEGVPQHRDLPQGEELFGQRPAQTAALAAGHDDHGIPAHSRPTGI